MHLIDVNTLYEMHTRQMRMIDEEQLEKCFNGTKLSLTTFIKRGNVLSYFILSPNPSHRKLLFACNLNDFLTTKIDFSYFCTMPVKTETNLS